jgi:hypothetical protein
VQLEREMVLGMHNVPQVLLLFCERLEFGFLEYTPHVTMFTKFTFPQLRQNPSVLRVIDVWPRCVSNHSELCFAGRQLNGRGQGWR